MKRAFDVLCVAMVVLACSLWIFIGALRVKDRLKRDRLMSRCGQYAEGVYVYCGGSIPGPEVRVWFDLSEGIKEAYPGVELRSHAVVSSPEKKVECVSSGANSACITGDGNVVSYGDGK